MRLTDFDDTDLEKYGSYSAVDLVKITHHTGSPWCRYNSNIGYQKMSDECIKQYHHNDTI